MEGWHTDSSTWPTVALHGGTSTGTSTSTALTGRRAATLKTRHSAAARQGMRLASRHPHLKRVRTPPTTSS